MDNSFTTADFCKRVILGTAVGDSIGLPAEGMRPQAIRRRWQGPWKQRLFFGKGMVSDDTEHTVFVAQALIRHSVDPDAFQKTLALKLRWWLVCLPAGIGLATLRATLKLWLGFGTRSSGVFSAGNGPAMRSAVIGAFFSGQPDRISSFVQASTRLTHTDPKAEVAAQAVAATAAWATVHPERPDTSIIGLWRSFAPDDKDWDHLMEKLSLAMRQNQSVEQLASSLNLNRGVSGYAYHSVPVALFAWWRHHGDYRETIESVIRCGGDTDTVAAIAGGLAAIRSEIPKVWLKNLWDFPVSLPFLCRLGSLADQASAGEKVAGVSLAWTFLPFRNVFFLVVVLSHGFRRLLPF